MGVIEEILKNREGMIEKFLDVLSGKEATAKVNLDGVQFNIGKSKVRLEGEISFTVIPGKKK
jgi:hypothetical protein